MENTITLTIDEIHAIRVEHSEKTKCLPFDEYRRLLDREAAPARAAIERARKESRENNAQL